MGNTNSNPAFDHNQPVGGSPLNTTSSSTQVSLSSTQISPSLTQIPSYSQQTPLSSTQIPLSSTQTPLSSTQTPLSSSTTQTQTSLSQPLKYEAVVGIAVGAFAAGLIICCFFFLVWYFHKRSSKSEKYITSASSSTHGTNPVVATDQKSPPMTEQTVGHRSSTILHGWRKHLPQDLNTDKIAKIFQTIFQDTRVFLEDSYQNTAHELSSSEVSSLRMITTDELSTVLLHASNSVPVLEAIMINWMVNGISFIDGGADLLPPEYSGVPKILKWNTVKSGHEEPLTVESKKGFLPAFNEWRKLTGFLYPDPDSNQEFMRDLDGKIGEAVSLFGEAFSPWNSTRQDQTSRDRNLYNIFHKASEAGILLFQQSSMFMFDYQRHNRVFDGKIVITPALVMKADDNERVFQPTEIVFGSREVRIN